MIRDFISLCAVVSFVTVFTLWASVATSSNVTEQRPQFAQVEDSK
ncbi:hypothetical protein [Brucella sp.]|nr:hypothetical protein [Brucella sp.]